MRPSWTIKVKVKAMDHLTVEDKILVLKPFVDEIRRLVSPDTVIRHTVIDNYRCFIVDVTEEELLAFKLGYSLKPIDISYVPI